MVKRVNKRLISWVAVLLVTGCSTLTDSKKKELNRMADSTVAKVVLEQSGLQAEMSISAGYIAIERSGSGIPMVGKRGKGVLVNQITGKRSFINVTHLEVDGAWGVGDYNGVMVIRDKKSVDQAETVGLTLENTGTIYIYVAGEGSAVYPVKIIRMEPVEL